MTYFVWKFKVTFHDMDILKLKKSSNYRLVYVFSSSVLYAGGKPIPMLLHWCISFHSSNIMTLIFNLCSFLAMDKNGSFSSKESSLLRLHLAM